MKKDSWHAKFYLAISDDPLPNNWCNYILGLFFRVIALILAIGVIFLLIYGNIMIFLGHLDEQEGFNAGCAYFAFVLDIFMLVIIFAFQHIIIEWIINNPEIKKFKAKWCKPINWK